MEVSHVPVAEDHPFAYKVVGVIGGSRPAALFEDSAGNQKVVPEGTRIDSDSRVMSVGDGTVSISFRGKTLRLSVGGDPVGKK
jgi:hypothetical protein